jgi:hypothetical protein
MPYDDANLHGKSTLFSAMWGNTVRHHQPKSFICPIVALPYTMAAYYVGPIGKPSPSNIPSCSLRRHRKTSIIINVTITKTPGKNHLESVSEERGIVATVLLKDLLLPGVLLRSLVREIASLVLTAEIQRHEDGESTAHRRRREQDEMTGSVARGFDGAEDESRNGTAKITLKKSATRTDIRSICGRGTYKADMHGNTNSSLQRSTNVVAVPGNTLRHVGVDARGDQEAGEILGTKAVGASQNCETSDTAKSQ